MMGSWMGNGPNPPVSGDQLTKVLGQDTFSDLGGRTGVKAGDAAGQLAGILPGLIDYLTPKGQVPGGGLGNAGDLMGMLGGLLRK